MKFKEVASHTRELVFTDASSDHLRLTVYEPKPRYLYVRVNDHEAVEIPRADAMKLAIRILQELA